MLINNRNVIAKPQVDDSMNQQLSRLFVFTLYCWFLLFIPSATAQQAKLDSMLLELKTAKEDTNKTKLLYRISEQYSKIDKNKYVEYVHWGMKQARQIKFDRGIAVFTTSMGHIHIDNGRYDSAAIYYKKAYELNKGIPHNERGVALNLMDMAVAAERKSDHIQALAYFNEAIPVLEKIEDYLNLAVAYHGIATILSLQGNHDQALSYAKKALHLTEEHQLSTFYGEAYNSMATVYAKLRDTLNATEYQKKALKAYEQQENTRGIAQVYFDLSELETRDYILKLNYLFESQKMWNETAPGHPVAISTTGTIGETYLSLATMDGWEQFSPASAILPNDKNKLLALADKYVSEALTLSRETGLAQNLMYYLGIKASIENEQGRFKQAFDNLYAHLLLYDSLYSQENKNQIASLVSQQEIDLRDKEIAIRDLRIRQFWLYGIIALVVIVALSTYLLHHSRIRALHLKSKIKENELQQRAESLLLEQKISDSELKAIRSQMNPHFIFNVLNSIESYILDNDPKTASMLVQKFAALSRLVLENSTRSLVTLDREWDAVRLYVELESIRFDHQFSYTFAYQSNLPADTLLIPPMLIQPLLENAIHHGLRHLKDYKGELHTTISDTGDKLVITVADNGIGMNHSTQLNKPSALKQQSLGITGIKERIAIINVRQEDSPASFTLLDLYESGEKGTKAILVLPLVFVERSVEA